MRQKSEIRKNRVLAHLFRFGLHEVICICSHIFTAAFTLRSPDSAKPSLTRERAIAMEHLWIVWLLAAVVFAVAEVFTSGFVLLWFGIGALCAMTLALTGIGGIGLQTGAFLLASTVLTALSRTLLLKYLPMSSSAQSVKLGGAALPGQIGVVITPSQGVRGAAEVKVYGSVWKAYPDGDAAHFEEGQEVEVTRVEGMDIYARPARREPSWRNLAH